MATSRRKGAGCVGVACEHTLGQQPLHLYGFLWTKPEHADDQCGAFSFVVPDTVLFKHQKPVRWFFTSKQERGKILCKSKKNVSVSNVLQAFLEPKLANTRPGALEDDAVLATFAYAERGSGGELVMVVEHLTKPGLHHLLTHREKPSLSILQRFIPTRSGYNHLIQSVFTPDSCLLRKCVSSHLVSDTRISIARRTVTFEADDTDVKPRDVSNRELREKLEHMNLEIGGHLERIIGKQIARNVSYFKVGADNRVYLLWSTLLSFETGVRAFAKNHKLSLCHQDRFAQSISSQRDTSETNTASASHHSQAKVCPECAVVLPREQVDFYVTFKAVIKCYDAEQRDPRDPLVPDVSGVPPLLQKYLGPVKNDRYNEMIRDPAFQYRTLQMCQGCSTKYSSRRSVDAKVHVAVSTGPPEKAPSKPIYMQSAHSIFWGKVERDAAQKKHASLRRPSSAVAVSGRNRASIQVTNSKPSRPVSLYQFLPALASAEVVPIREPPSHCLKKFAEHLERSSGGPSVRLALARANIFPTTSLVSLEMLQWICDRKLLADVFVYWGNFCRANGNEYSASSIDMDALDAILSTYVEKDVLGQEYSRIKAPRIPDSTKGGLQFERSAITHTPSLLFHTIPARPTRPNTSLPTARTSRASRVVTQSTVVESTAAASPILDTRDCSNVTGSHSGTPCDFPDNARSDDIQERMRRTLGDVECFVDVSAEGGGFDDVYTMQIRAKRANSSDGSVMILTLNSEKILELVARQASACAVPSSKETLVEFVFRELIVFDGNLVVRDPPTDAGPPASDALRPPQTETPTSTTPTSNHAVASVDSGALTEDEMRLLHDALREHDGC